MNRQKGFTLIEAMVVVAIIGILAALAYPAYEQYITRSKRNDAMAAMMNAAQAMERFRAANFTYQVPANNLSTIFSTRVPVDAGEAYYNLSLVSAANTYTLTATPTGSMLGKDTPKVGNNGILTLSHDGTRGWGTRTCWPEGTSDC